MKPDKTVSTRKGAAKRTDRTPKKARARKAKPDWAPAFLAAFADTGLVIEAAKVAGAARSTVYARRSVDAAFADAWSDVEEASTEALEQVAVKRAQDGSDVLLIFLLKARRPDTYRDNSLIEHKGALVVAQADITTVSAEEASDAAHDFLARLAGPSA